MIQKSLLIFNLFFLVQLLSSVTSYASQSTTHQFVCTHFLKTTNYSKAATLTKLIAITPSYFRKHSTSTSPDSTAELLIPSEAKELHQFVTNPEVSTHPVELEEIFLSEFSHEISAHITVNLSEALKVLAAYDYYRKSSLALQSITVVLSRLSKATPALAQSIFGVALRSKKSSAIPIFFRGLAQSPALDSFISSHEFFDQYLSALEKAAKNAHVEVIDSRALIVIAAKLINDLQKNELDAAKEVLNATSTYFDAIGDKEAYSELRNRFADLLPRNEAGSKSNTIGSFSKKRKGKAGTQIEKNSPEYLEYLRSFNPNRKSKK